MQSHLNCYPLWSINLLKEHIKKGYLDLPLSFHFTKKFRIIDLSKRVYFRISAVEVAKYTTNQIIQKFV